MSSDYKDANLALMHKDIAYEIFSIFQRWLESSDTAEDVIADFQSQMQMTTQRLRPSSTQLLTEKVVPLRVNPDGTLQVIVSCYAVL
jgi:hypothetical protein